jgi:hypothetical protein
VNCAIYDAPVNPSTVRNDSFGCQPGIPDSISSDVLPRIFALERMWQGSEAETSASSDPGGQGQEISRLAVGGQIRGWSDVSRFSLARTHQLKYCKRKCSESQQGDQKKYELVTASHGAG